MQILKPKFDSHEASFDSQTRTSTRVSTARFTRETMQGHSKHAVFMARCESKGKRAFYFKTSLLKPVYDLVEFSFKLPLERSVPVIFSSMVSSPSRDIIYTMVK
jgi:hypothetical protein